MKKYWIWIISILGIELLIACATPVNVLTTASWLDMFVSFIRRISPNIDYFTADTVPYPEVAKLYLATSLLLLIPKIYFIFIWLNSNKKIYDMLVVSPLTCKTGQSVGEFIVEPMLADGQKMPEKTGRSMFNRIVWSTLILAFGAGLFFMLTSHDSGEILFSTFYKSRFEMWASWSLKMLILIPFYFAVCVCILRDYSLLIANIFKN